MVEKLTDEQAAKMADYANKWIQKGLDDTMPEMAEIESIIGRVYAELKMETPPIVVVDSPVKAAKLAKEKYGATDVSFSWMHHECDSAAFFEFFKNEVPEVTGIDHKTDLVCDMTKLGWTLFYDEVCIVSKKPKVHFKVPQSEIVSGDVAVCHNLNGPAIDFGKDDPSNVYMVDGKVVERHVVETTTQEEDMNQDLEDYLL